MLLFLILIPIHGILFCWLGKTERGKSLTTKGNSGPLTEGGGVVHHPLCELRAFRGMSSEAWEDSVQAACSHTKISVLQRRRQ